MRKKIGTLLIVASLGALCAGLCACSNGTEKDDQFKKGNVITVTYDGSGGQILGSKDVSLIDMFNPNKYTADENGYVHIKLRSPTDPKRPTNGNDITVTRGEESLVGWYRQRTLDLKDGKVVDRDGNELTLRNGQYYLVTTNEKGETVEKAETPAYKYSEPWNFEEDTIDFKIGSERLETTLYAAWIDPFSFEYYYKENQTDTEWKLYSTTKFNYMAATAENNLDTAFLPQWSLGENGTGRMEYRRGSNYVFPSIDGKTFKTAYQKDEAGNLQKIETSLKHAGSLEKATATPVDPVQKIYVEFDEGTHYRIETAEQFAAIADRNGIYTILSDELDFKCKLSEAGGLSSLQDNKERVGWPNGFTTSEFTGQIKGEGGKAVKFKNVGITYSKDSGATLGGLFGKIAASATIQNVTFENVILNIAKAINSTLKSNFGLLAGEIETNASLSVTIGGEIHLGEVKIGKEQQSFNLVANGDYTGVVKTEILLKVYGKEVTGGVKKYRFDVNPETCKVDENGDISFELTPGYPITAKDRPDQFYTISQNQT